MQQLNTICLDYKALNVQKENITLSMAGKYNKLFNVNFN